ncbi:hypothetical protein [Virgisporangium aurantiacum]|uniref:Uncharacterized protein n=1 Tax=Virgisporangium aurantiacum TaxID=175570 RepID=A0A8J4E3S8_9ACTN|nr:hypothetical protein [Virgisporangium aurantiacum]GIJ58287.1 hypothetical protein Vau01_058030 [Virgisporangium aurantiacum]
MTGVETAARHGLRRRATAGALGLVVLVYFAAWFAIMLAGLFGGPIDYRMAGSIVLAGAGTVLIVGIPLIAAWVLAGRGSPPSIRLEPWLRVFLVVSVVMLVGVIAWRGVVSPFAPVATRLDPACASLDAAGLAAHWPADTRELNQDDTDFDGDLTPYSICGWTMKLDAKPPAPYVGVSARVTRFDGTGTSSGLAAAIRYFRGDLDDITSPLRIDDIGDEAYATSSTTSAEVVARRANVVVSVEFSLRGDSSGPDPTIAVTAARDLAGRIVAGIKVR